MHGIGVFAPPACVQRPLLLRGGYRSIAVSTDTRRVKPRPGAETFIFSSVGLFQPLPRGLILCPDGRAACRMRSCLCVLMCEGMHATLPCCQHPFLPACLSAHASHASTLSVLGVSLSIGGGCCSPEPRLHRRLHCLCAAGMGTCV
jgi:hypothetical protein